jgi:hypothetical protein
LAGEDVNNKAPCVAPVSAGIIESPVFTKNGMEKELCQGEILSDVMQYDYSISNQTTTALHHDYVVILSQDCDLESDYNLFLNTQSYTMLGILVCKMHIESEIRSRKEIHSRIWDRIVDNNDSRYHYIEGCPAESDLEGVGFPSLVIDFKRYFTISPTSLYDQFSTEKPARRRCRLEVPYKEHLQSRAAYYLQRVSLPAQHKKPSRQTNG